MAYSTTKQVTERSGLGLRILDENVGTGDNSATSFDLDNINIISGTYTLSHAASGSNSFTDLTETTHYTLDKESGKIELTAGGVTEVGTDIIYATYWYTDLFSDSVISDLITNSDDEIDKYTNKKWDSPVSVTEYHTGKKRSWYPTTNYPYDNDYDKPDFIMLKNSPITSVDNVYFLSQPQPVSACFNYDDGTAAYTDIKTNVNSITVSPVNIFDSSPGNDDIIYIGGSQRFLGLTISLSTAGVDSGTTAIDWEYWNGTVWTDISETDTDTGASLFTISGTFTWTFPYGWEKTTVNSSDSLYWIRGKLTTSDYSTNPVLATLTMLDSINTPLEPREVIVENGRKLNFVGQFVMDGVKNVRVDYNYGQTSTPTYITELSMLLVSLRMMINLSGGSYDDATSYTLGSKSVTIGEVYVNIREVISQIRNRIKEIYAMIGKRGNIGAI